MYELSVKTHFSAAHHLEGYPGSCAAMHGHNWGVEVFVRGEQLDAAGMLLDFRRLKTAVRDVLQEVDHTDLNRVPGLNGLQPTSENLARFLFERLGRALNDGRCRVARVKITETPNCDASYWEEGGAG